MPGPASIPFLHAPSGAIHGNAIHDRGAKRQRSIHASKMQFIPKAASPLRSIPLGQGLEQGGQLRRHLFVGVQGGVAVGADAVIARRVPLSVCEQIAEGLNGALADHAMRRDTINDMRARGCAVWRQDRNCRERAVAH